MFNFKNLLEEAVAQANPWDSGKTAKTVRSNRQAVIAQTKKQDEYFKSPQWQDIQRKANTRNTQKFQSGQIDRPAYEKQRDIVLGNGAPIQNPELSKWEKRNLAFANAVAKNDILRPTLTGLATLSPTSYGGEIIAYGGRAAQAAGWDDGKYLAQAGDNVAGYSKADPQGAFRNQGLGDSLIHGGIELAGDILNPITRTIAPIKYGTRSANDLAREMEASGQYTPQQSFAAGTGLGVVSGALERTGIDKITGKAVGKGLRGVTTRLVTSGLTEGATEGAQEVAENLARKYTVNPDQNVMENVATSALVGGILGSGARGAVELGNPKVRQAAKDTTTKAKQVADKANNEINLGKVTENKNKQIARRDTISAQKAEALRNNNKPEYRRLSKVEADLNDSIKKLEKREKFLGTNLGLSMKLTNDAELNAQNNTDTNLSPDQDNKTASLDNTNPLESLKQEARKYKSAEEFADTLLQKNPLPKNSGQIKAEKIRPEMQALEQKYIRGEATKADNARYIKLQKELESIDSRDTLAQYLGDDYDLKSQKTKLTDLYNQATQSQPQTPQGKVDSKPTLQDALEGRSTKVSDQTKPQKTLKQPKVQKESLQPSQTPQKTELSKGKPEKAQIQPANKQIEISSDGRIANIDQYIKKQVNAQEVETKKSVKDKVKTLKRQWVDTLAPAEDNFRQLVKDGKISQETLDDIIVKNGKSLRSGTMANLNLVESGLVDLIYKKSKTDYDNLGQTLIAIHSKDLRANGIETGRDAKVDDQIIAKYGKQFKSDMEQFKKSADYVLNQSVEAQLISKETAKLLKEKYPNYVPMNRVIEEIEAKGSFNSGQVASIGKQTVVRKIKGSKRVVENPMESMISKVQDMSKQKLRNEAALSWVDALKDVGEAKLVKEVKPGDSTVSVLRNGTKEIYKVDPEMEAAAKGLTKEQMNVMVDVARKVSRVFKTGTTGMNLPFIVTNLARDQQTAFLNMQKGEVEVFKAIPSTIFETLGHGKLYKEAVRQGAISTSFDLTKPNLKQTAKGIRKKGASLGTFSKIEDVIGRSEEYTRLQQYKATKEYWLKKGFSEDKAITKATIAAQQNSADFARAGDFGRIINAVMPYTNAGVQGTRAYLRSAVTNPKRYAIKATATIAMPMAMVALWNYGDDEREKIINDISDFDKQANFIIVTPWAKKNEEGKWEGLVKIPKPPGISALTYPIEQTIAWAAGNDPVGLRDISTAILGFGSPLGDNLNSAASTVTPQAIKPLAEVAINRNIFTGRDIVPFYMKNKPTNEQAYSYTSGTARGVGKAINSSPLNIEHLIRGYGGEVGLQGLNLADNALNKAGVIPEEQIGGRSIPAGFSRRFTEAYDQPDSKLDKGSTTSKTIQAKGDTVGIADKTEKDSSGKYVNRDKYDSVLNAFEKSDGKLNNIQKYGNDELKKAISDVSTEAKNEFESAGLPTKGIKFDSILARDYASYKKGLAGKDEIGAQKAAESFIKSTYKSTLDKTSQSFYTLGDDDMRTELQEGTISKAQMDKIIELDDMLTANGLQSYPQVGKTLRRELGYSVASSGKSGKKSSGRKSGGSKAKASTFDLTKLFGFGSPATSTNKSLRALLNSLT